MAENKLDGVRVAILVSSCFEQSELTEPRKALEEAGATTHIVSVQPGTIRAMKNDEKADTFNVDFTLDQVTPEEFDAVLLPGGVFNSDFLRADERAQEFVQAIDNVGKPIAVICHAPWLLISAGLVEGRTLTSYYTIEDDVRNAGGRWTDEEVVRDDNWVSSREPADLPAFNREMIIMFDELKGPKEQSRAA
jgi:protease I